MIHTKVKVTHETCTDIGKMLGRASPHQCSYRFSSPAAKPLVCCCWKGGAPKGLLVTGCGALYALAMTDCTLSAKGLLLRPSKSSLGRAAPDVGVAVVGEAWDANGLLAVAGVLEAVVVVSSFKRCSCKGND